MLTVVSFVSLVLSCGPVSHDGDHVACEARNTRHVTFIEWPPRPSVLWNHELEHEERNRKLEPPLGVLFNCCGLDKYSSKIMSWRPPTPPTPPQRYWRVGGTFRRWGLMGRSKVTGGVPSKSLWRPWPHLPLSLLPWHHELCVWLPVPHVHTRYGVLCQ